MEENSVIRPELENRQEERLENSLRPQSLDEYIGQTKVKENMKIYIEAAKKRGEPLDHCLFYGPPGLGKTTIANIIANEMHSNIKITSGPAIEKPGDLAAILTTLSEFDVLFIEQKCGRNIVSCARRFYIRYCNWYRAKCKVYQNRFA